MIIQGEECLGRQERIKGTSDMRPRSGGNVTRNVTIAEGRNVETQGLLGFLPLLGLSRQLDIINCYNTGGWYRLSRERLTLYVWYV